MSQFSLILRASGLWHYKRTLFHAGPLKGTGVSIYLFVHKFVYVTVFVYANSSFLHSISIYKVQTRKISVVYGILEKLLHKVTQMKPSTVAPTIKL